MKIIKLSNKNFELFKEFCEEWIDERNELIDDCIDSDEINELSEHIMFDVYESVEVGEFSDGAYRVHYDCLTEEEKEIMEKNNAR